MLSSFNYFLSPLADLFHKSQTIKTHILDFKTSYMYERYSYIWWKNEQKTFKNYSIYLCSLNASSYFSVLLKLFLNKKCF